MRLDACEKYYVIVAEQNPPLGHKHLNFESICEIFLLLMVQIKVGMKISIFTDKKFDSSFIILLIYYLLEIPFPYFSL